MKVKRFMLMGMCGVGSALALGLFGARAGQSEADQPVEFTAPEIRRILQHELSPVPADPTNAFADEPAAARLGQFLFFEKRLSANGAVSCATCHQPARSFTDGQPLATGLKPLNRHTPSLWNVAYNRWFFWDGRADTLWAQALEPFEREDEFGSDRLHIAHVVYNDEPLRRVYEAVFGPMPALHDSTRFPAHARPVADDVNHPLDKAWRAMSLADQQAVNRVVVNLAKSIAAYERMIVTRQSPFDRFVEGLKEGDPVKRAALSPAAQRGLRLFIDQANCRLCHSGPNFTDGEFHNTGAPPRDGLPPDAGRFHGAATLKNGHFSAAAEHSDDPNGAAAQRLATLIQTPESWGQFKTPSLRNVVQTAPYMHQGQFATLREVLHFYSTREGSVQIGHHQETLLIPLNLAADQIDDLAAFLESLTGQPLPESLLAPPSSPALAP